jgi:hypothetical protein
VQECRFTPPSQDAGITVLSMGEGTLTHLPFRSPDPTIAIHCNSISTEGVGHCESESFFRSLAFPLAFKFHADSQSFFSICTPSSFSLGPLQVIPNMGLEQHGV